MLSSSTPRQQATCATPNQFANKLAVLHAEVKSAETIPALDKSASQVEQVGLELTSTVFIAWPKSAWDCVIVYFQIVLGELNARSAARSQYLAATLGRLEGYVVGMKERMNACGDEGIEVKITISREEIEALSVITNKENQGGPPSYKNVILSNLVDKALEVYISSGGNTSSVNNLISQVISLDRAGSVPKETYHTLMKNINTQFKKLCSTESHSLLHRGPTLTPSGRGSSFRPYQGR